MRALMNKIMLNEISKTFYEYFLTNYNFHQLSISIACAVKGRGCACFTRDKIH